jgi:hypothetical protein
MLSGYDFYRLIQPKLLPKPTMSATRLPNRKHAIVTTPNYL